MKRLAISLEQLAERSNLVLATWKAARGKQQRPPVARFLGDLDARLDRLAASILCGQAPQGQYTSFIVHDAKRRFANAYLDAADRWLLEHARVRAHVRYMDDILWWCDSRAEAKATLDELSDFLWRERRLQLKPSAPIAPSRSGVAWCGTPVNSAACLQGKKCCLARAARWLLEQQRQERPLSEPQRQRARQRQPEQRFPLCPELDRRGVWQPPGMDLPLPMDQVLFPVAVALWSPSELKGSWGAGSEGAAASSRQLPGSPPAACSR